MPVPETWLEELAPAVCTHLLETSIMGRLGVIVDGHPEVFPVNHVYDRESGLVVFPSNARTKLHAALDAPVCFEVDGIDPGGRSAWSVMVVGRAEELADPVVAQRAENRRHVLWAVGPGSHWVGISQDRITGRRISTLPAG